MTGPSPSNFRSSIAAAYRISRTEEARNASSAASRSAGVHGASPASISSNSRARVIEARMWSSSGGVSSAPLRTQNSVEVGASSTRPCGVSSSASSNPRSCASRVASMFAAYESDLIPSSTRVGAYVT